jgi:hypothetical protein
MQLWAMKAKRGRGKMAEGLKEINAKPMVKVQGIWQARDAV